VRELLYALGSVAVTKSEKKKTAEKKNSRKGEGGFEEKLEHQTASEQESRKWHAAESKKKKKNRDTGMHKHTQWHDQQTPRACGLTSPSTHDPPRASGPCCVRPFRLRSSGFSSSNVSLDNQKHTHTYLPKKKKTGFDNVLFNSPATE
jgi:hypothetical protein